MKYLALAVSLLLTSCFKDLSDASNINAVKFDNFNGIYALAMVNSKVTIEDLINNRDERDYVRDNKNGYLSVVFDTISSSLSVNQYVKIPNVSETISLAVPAIPGFNAIPDGTEVALVSNNSLQQSITLAGIELDKIAFESGTLQLDLINSTSHVMNYEIVFPDLKNSAGVPLTVSQAASGASTKVSIDLQNYSMDLTGGIAGDFNKLVYKISCKITKNGATQPTDIGFKFNVTNIAYKSITGYFGQQSVALPINPLKIDLFKNNTEGKLEVENPSIKISLVSDFRAPIKLTLVDDKFNVRYNDSKVDNITGLPFPYTLQGAPSDAIPFKDSIVSGVITPNIGSIVLKNPTSLEFGINTQLNPNGKTAQRNIIRNTDKIKLTSIFELPLKAKASNFRIDKSIKADIADIKNADSIIDKVEVKILAENTLPIDAIVQLECIHPVTKVSVLSLLAPNQLVLKGSQGSVPTTTETLVTVSGNDWRRLSAMGVNEIQMINKLSTANGGSSFEVLQRSQYIQLKLGAKLFLKSKF